MSGDSSADSKCPFDDFVRLPGLRGHLQDPQLSLPVLPLHVPVPSETSKCAPAPPQELPKILQGNPTSTDTTYLTTARAHSVSLPSSKFQAAARQTSVHFRGQKGVLFCFVCKVLPVFISLKNDERISYRMVKTELAAEAEQEISLISAQKLTSDEALCNQKRH